jgi:hypothetical protein
LINRQHADGVVIAGSSGSVEIRGLLAVILVLTIRDGLVIRFLAPFLPGLAGLRREKLLALKSLLNRKLRSPFADQQHVRGLLHDTSCYRDRMSDVLHCRYRATIPKFVHDAGVQRDMPIAIGIAGTADRMIFQVRFRDARTCLDSVYRSSAGGQYRPCSFVGGDAKIPR